ncbi:hypothetical protein [Vibrio rotiferianus]
MKISDGEVGIWCSVEGLVATRYPDPLGGTPLFGDHNEIHV